MSVLIETSVGDLVIDLLVDDCPQTCLNFLKLCKIKYYNFSPFWNVQKDFMVQTGDPTATGKGGESVFGIINGPSRRYFPAEIKPHLKHRQKGTISMAASGDATGSNGVSGSQFFITTADGLDYLDGKYTVFGNVAEGWDTLDKINETYCDETGRPLKDVRIRHTVILDDPYPDPKGLVIPDRSPMPTKEMMNTIRIADDEEIEDDRPSEVVEREVRDQEAKAQALTLEMVGDLPFAEIKPPENVLFVCKLNPVTRDEDLELIFSRFGTISNCEVIRDKKTGDSLSYAFIEFDEREACEEAYFKMQNCLIDERRIKVDFSQSVSKLHANWVTGRQGAGYAGSSNLVKKSKYRGQPDKVDRDEYDMVFESMGTPSSDKNPPSSSVIIPAHRSNKDDNDRKSGRGDGDGRNRDERRAPVGGDRDRDSDRRSRDERRAPVSGDRDRERRESREIRSGGYRDRGSNDYRDRDHRRQDRERGSRRSRSRSPRESGRRDYKYRRGGQ